MARVALEEAECSLPCHTFIMNKLLKEQSMELTQEYLKSILNYNPDTGIFTWKVNRGRLAKAGNKAGCICKEGYTIIEILRKKHAAHRLVWLYMYDQSPNDCIDHINHTRTDNRLINLRELKRAENQKNGSMRKDNTTGFKGVYWIKRLNKYVVSIRLNRKTKHYGCFSLFEDARQRAIEVYKELGFHENHYLNNTSKEK